MGSGVRFRSGRMLYKAYVSLERPDSMKLCQTSQRTVCFVSEDTAPQSHAILACSRTPNGPQSPGNPCHLGLERRRSSAHGHQTPPPAVRQAIHGMSLVYEFSIMRPEIHWDCRGGGKERVRPLPQQPATLQRASRSCHTQLPHSIHVKGCPASYICAGRVGLAFVICNSPL